jgi:hypothetical protein
MGNLLSQLIQQTDQGTVYSTNLFNVLITPAGSIYAGAVPVAALNRAAKAGL